MHPDVCRIKTLARSFGWWPGIDTDIESCIQSCLVCQVNRKINACHGPLLHLWEFPQKPWSCIHLDYAGPCEGKMLLIIVDANSKWLDVHPMNTSTTIGKLHLLFARGVMVIVVGNGHGDSSSNPGRD